MIKELEESYENCIFEMQKVLHENPKYLELKQQMNKEISILVNKLASDQKEQFSDILEMKNELFAYEQELTFQMSYKMGINIMKKMN